MRLAALGILTLAPLLLAAHAADRGTTLVFGTVLENCTVTAPPPSTVSVVSTDRQPIGDFSYTCNFIGPSASIRFWSTNGGALVNPDGGGQRLDYLFFWRGVLSDATLVTDEAMATPVTANPGAPVNSLVSLEGAIALLETGTVAGRFADTIFIGISP